MATDYRQAVRFKHRLLQRVRAVLKDPVVEGSPVVLTEDQRYEAVLVELLDFLQPGMSHKHIQVRSWLVVRSIEEDQLAEKLPQLWTQIQSVERLEGLKELVRLQLGVLSQAASAILQRFHPSDIRRTTVPYHRAKSVLLPRVKVNTQNSGEVKSELEQLYSLALSLNNESFCNEWFRKGVELDDAGLYVLADDSYAKSVEVEPEFAMYYRKTISQCEELLKQQPSDHRVRKQFSELVYRRRATYLIQMGLEDLRKIFNNNQYLAARVAGNWALPANNPTVLIQSLETALTQEIQMVEEECHYLMIWGQLEYYKGNLGQSARIYHLICKTAPEKPFAWHGLGFAIGHSNPSKYANIIVDCADKCISLTPIEHQNGAMWSFRSWGLESAKRFEEMVLSCQEMILIYKGKEGWRSRGNAVRKCAFMADYRLEMPFNRPSSSSSGFYENLFETGVHSGRLRLRGVVGEIENYLVSFQYVTREENPLEWSLISHSLGNAYFDYALIYEDGICHWGKAREAYEESLHILTMQEYGEKRLEVLGRLIRNLIALKELDTAAAISRQGYDLLRRLITEAEYDGYRKYLGLKSSSFRENTVDIWLNYGEGNPVKALLTAEKDKNQLMTWMMAGWQDAANITTPSYAEMRSLLTPDAAILYWHISANALTVFILHPYSAQPIVIQTPENTPKSRLFKVKALEEWLYAWNESYQASIEEDEGEDEGNAQPARTEWRSTLIEKLDQLAAILNIRSIKNYLQTIPGITKLILVPHRDLHRLPLHCFFQGRSSTYLPSLQIGINLRSHIAPAIPSVLNIMAPQSDARLAADPNGVYAEIESEIIPHVLSSTHQVTTVPSDQATVEQISIQIQHPHQILHFNGHASHNFSDPSQSALALAGDDRLTMGQIRQLALDTYYLVTLASCETALTSDQTITTEFVGLTSALLSHRIPHILSTLWPVQADATMLFMVQFYSHLHLGIHQAFDYSQTWLRMATATEIIALYQIWMKDPALKSLRSALKTECKIVSTMDTSCRPYEHPYYWAAFILSGRA